MPKRKAEAVETQGRTRKAHEQGVGRELERMLAEVRRREEMMRSVQRILLQHLYGLRHAMDMTILALRAKSEQRALRAVNRAKRGTP
jgi:hypothetical protein